MLIKTLVKHCTKALLPDGAYSKSVETVQSQRSASHRTRREGGRHGEVALEKGLKASLRFIAFRETGEPLWGSRQRLPDSEIIKPV